MIEFNEIKKLIPHRYPFIFIDKVLELEPGKRIVALKNISSNEWYFQGHFPEEAVVPGVIIVEGMAQTAAVLASVTAKELSAAQDRFYYFGAINKFRFLKKVLPGDQIIFTVDVEKFIEAAGIVSGIATVGGETVAKGELVFGSQVTK